MFNQEYADFAISFVECLKHVDGKWYGVPFYLLDWQKNALTEFYGTVKENGARQYQYLYLEIPKKNGKALALDTKIPTPNGWTTMGEIKIGDKIFGENGKQYSVIGATEVMYNRPCYEVVFEDGTKITADEEHLWETSTYNPWMKTSVKTTKDIADTITYQNGSNHKVRLCLPIECDEKELPIQPYLLGVWLGDGTSVCVNFTCHADDLEIKQKINQLGIKTHYVKNGKKAKHIKCVSLAGDKNNPVQIKLKELGVFKNKHIPAEYLRASVNQRMDLLKGLMDTDGYCSKTGQCEFTTTSERLYIGIMELLCSLGYKPTVKIDNSFCNGKQCRLKYRVQFWAYKDKPVFYLQRKANRQKENPINKTRASFRKIKSVTKIKSVPVRCIKVSNPTGLFLCGETMIPTHNSETAAALGLYHTFADGEMQGEVYVCAADIGNANIIFRAALGMLKQNPTLSKQAKVKESTREIHDTVSGTFMKVMSSEAFSKHGYKPSCVIFDELHTQPNRELWDVMTFGSGSARFQPVWIVLTTAGDDPDKKSIGWEIHEKAYKILQYRKGNTDGNYDNPVWLPIIYGLGEVDAEKSKEIDIYDEDLWYACNPSLGETIEIDTLRQEALDARQSEYSERLFRWLRLNQWISTKAVGWLPLTLYDKTEAPIPDLKGKRCYPGLDLSSTTDLTALVLTFPPQEGLPYWYTLFIPWITSEKMRERSKRDHVDFEKWVREGYVKTTPGDCIDFDFVEAEIYRIAKEYDLKILGCDPYLSRMLTQHVMKNDIDVVEIPQDMKNLSPAMKKIEELLIKGEMKHEKNPCARWCFGNVRVATDGNENIKPMKNKSIGRIDVTVAWIISIATALLNEKESINDAILSDDWSM